MPIGSLLRSDGRECWIFGAAGPEELFGVHGELIAHALPPDEPLAYLVYFPIAKLYTRVYVRADRWYKLGRTIAYGTFLVLCGEVPHDLDDPGKPHNVRRAAASLALTARHLVTAYRGCHGWTSTGHKTTRRRPGRP